MSEERKQAKAKSLLETGQAMIREQATAAPMLEAGDRAAVTFTKDDDATRVAGAVAIGAHGEANAGAEKSQSKGWAIFGGFRWRK